MTLPDTPPSATDEPRSPVTGANLLVTLEAVIDGMGDLKAAIVHEQSTRATQIAEARRTARLAIATALIVLFLAAAGIATALIQNFEDRAQRQDLQALFRQTAEETRRREVDQCEASNNARGAIREAITVDLVDALAGAAPATPRTPEEQAQLNLRVAAFRADLDQRLVELGPRNCSPEALGLPPPPPPE